MEDVLDIQETQVAPPQDDPPIKKLYKGLYADKKYTKSFDEFKKQYSTPEAIDKLYNGLKEDGDYTKSKDDFQVQYFAEVKKKEPTPSGVSVGKLLSQDVEIPIVSLENTEGKNPIDLAQDYQSLKNKQKFPSEEEMGRSMGMAQPVPDEQGQKQAANLKDYLQNNHGIDPEDLYQETKRLQPNDFGRVGFSKEELLKDREENPQLYQRKIGRLNWERDLTDKLSQDLIDNRIDKDTFDRLHSNIQTLAENSNQGDYSNQREAVKSVSQIIQQFGGENKDQMLKDFAVEVGKVYGNSYNNKFTEATKDNPENKYLDNDFEKLGLQYIQDVDPEKAAQYDKLKIDPKTYKDNYDAVQGANHLHQTLAETGIALQENSVNEELNSLSKIADQNGGLDEIQLAKAKQLQEKQLWLQAEKFDLDKKYPERKGNKVNDAVQEILGQDLSWSKYAGLKTGSAINNTLEGIWEGVTSPFMSDASNTIRELAIMGSEPDFHLTDKNKSLQTDKLIINPELQPQIDAIKNDKTLTPEQKKGRMFDLLYHNTDKFGRVPISGGKFNISPSSILYGLTDLGATLVPFLTMEAVTGGGATASAGRKFLSTFTAAAATSFHEEYAAAIKEGVPQSEAYKRAMGMTAITSLAMAGAGTPQALREMAGTKTSAGKIISQMSDAELKKGLEDATKNKTMTALRNRLKATPQMAKEGLKTGLKFEGLMTAANEAKHQIYNTDIDREHNFKQSILNVANFGIIGTGLGHIGYEAPTDLQKSGLLKMGEKPDDFHFTLQEMKKDGGITQSEFDHRTELIDKAKEAYKTIPKANDKGIPLSETEKGEYLYNSVVKNEGKKAASTMPPKQAEKAEHTALVADFKNGILLEEPTDKQLETRQSRLEKILEPKPADSEAAPIPEKKLKEAKAELDAVKETIEDRKAKDVADENAKRLTEKRMPNEVQDDEIKIPAYKTIFENGTPEEKQDALKDISDQWHDPATREQAERDFGKKLTEQAVKQFPQENVKPLTIPAAEGEDKATGVKRAITDETRAANNFPKVELPKMTSDIEALQEAKDRVDKGEVNPQEMVDRIIKDKSGYKNEGEVMDMQYYAHQLERQNQELSTQLAEAKTPEQEVAITQQKLQLSDLMDAQTEAAQIAGNQWGKIGNRMQPVITDAGQIFRDNKATIKEAYGGEVPKEVQDKIDAITKERDDAIAAKIKVEEELKQKLAVKGFEEIKKRAAKSSRHKETAEQLKKEEQDLLQQLKDAGKADPNAPHRSGIALTDKHVIIIGKLAVNYFKQGVNGLDAIVDKIHDAVIDEIKGITRKDIRDLIANYDPLTLEREIERLNKKADLLDDKINPAALNKKGKPNEPIDFAKPSKVEKTFRNNTEWVKATQRVADAEFKMKILKRKAFESQKNFYQKALMWLGRGVRLSVLSGTNVLAKLAAALTIGGAIKRIPEQAIGAVYSKVFSGIAKKAPIESNFNWLNAKSEAKFYKELANPAKIVKNSWDILKTGSTKLGRKLGSAEYEHVPVLYLPTDLHQIIKDPLKRATYEASLKNGLIWAEKNGLDIQDPLVINSIENAAYKRAQYEIFQESNKLSRWFTSQKSSLEKKGNTGATAKFLVDFMIPVSTVPANIVRRATTTSPLGLIRGGTEVVQAYRKGIESLTPDEADHVMKQLKQGTLGTALWLIGWYGYNNFGGLYSHFNPNSKREEGDKPSDVMIVNGKEIPKPVQHALPLEVIQLAATARRIYENYRENKNASTTEALYKAGLGSIGAMMEQIPIIETPMHGILATQDPMEATKFQEDIERRIKPQIMREYGAFDRDFKKSKEGKFLDEKGLKIVDINKEGIHPLDQNGQKIKLTEEKFQQLKDVRERKIQDEITKLMKNGANIDGEEIQAKDLTPAQLRGWLMTTSTRAKKEAMDEVFGEQPETAEKPKVETNE